MEEIKLLEDEVIAELIKRPDLTMFLENRLASEKPSLSQKYNCATHLNPNDSQQYNMFHDRKAVNRTNELLNSSIMGEVGLQSTLTYKAQFMANV